MNWNDERGSALLMTIVVALVLAVIGGSYALMGMSETRQARLAVQDVQAFYVARSGADAVAQGLIDNPDKISEVIGLTSKAIEIAELGSFTVRVEDEEDLGMIRLISTGTVGSRSRTVHLTILKDNLMPDFDCAIFATGTGSSNEPVIRMEGSARIIGTAGTNSTGDSSIQFLWSTGVEGGDLLIGPGADPNQVISTPRPDINGHVNMGSSGDKQYKIASLEEFRDYPAPVFPDFPSNLNRKPDFVDQNIPIDDNGYYDLIRTSGNRSLYIDVNYGTRIIRVRELDLGGPIKLLNVGDKGQLLLYVDEKIKRNGGDVLINYPPNDQGPFNPKSLTLFYAGNDPFLDTQFKISGNVVVEKAPIELGHSARLRGNIFTGGDKVSITGGAEAAQGVIYAPKAEVTLAGSGSSGAIIANQLKATGNSRIIFSSEHVEGTFSESVLGLELGGSGGFTKGLWSAGK